MGKLRAQSQAALFFGLIAVLGTLVTVLGSCGLIND